MAPKHHKQQAVRALIKQERKRMVGYVAKRAPTNPTPYKDQPIIQYKQRVRVTSDTTKFSAKLSEMIPNNLFLKVKLRTLTIWGLTIDTDTANRIEATVDLGDDISMKSSDYGSLTSRPVIRFHPPQDDFYDPSAITISFDALAPLVCDFDCEFIIDAREGQYDYKSPTLEHVSD